MSKHTWSGGIDSNVVLEVVACNRGPANEIPNGLIIDREDSPGRSFVSIDADELFMVILRVEGVNIARLFGHEVIKQPWDK